MGERKNISEPTFMFSFSSFVLDFPKATGLLFFMGGKGGFEVLVSSSFF